MWVCTGDIPFFSRLKATQFRWPAVNYRGGFTVCPLAKCSLYMQQQQQPGLAWKIECAACSATETGKLKNCKAEKLRLKGAAERNGTGNRKSEGGGSCWPSSAPIRMHCFCWCDLTTYYSPCCSRCSPFMILLPKVEDRLPLVFTAN